MDRPTVAPGSPEADQRRTARLLFDAELSVGVVDEGSLAAAPVRLATGVGGVPVRGVRRVQQVLCKFGKLGYEADVARPLLRAREALLGRRETPPRLLVRVDEFPHYRAWDDPRRFGTAGFERFHEIMAGAGVPYLVAALPRVSREPLSPAPLGSRALDEGEDAMLRRMADEGVAFGLHGHDHRTRQRSSRRRSELCGLDAAQTRALLEEALRELGAHGVRPRVFVPPYNRFDARQLELLAGLFDVVCGGPESIGAMGFQRTPQWRGETVYMPAYAPWYGRASEVLAALQGAERRLAGLWVPVVLHWGWEAQEGWRSLERLARLMARWATPWEEFLAAVERSRGGDGERSRHGDSCDGDGERGHPGNDSRDGDEERNRRSDGGEPGV